MADVKKKMCRFVCHNMTAGLPIIPVRLRYIEKRDSGCFISFEMDIILSEVFL